MAKSDNTKLYLASLKKYGHNAKGLNWNSQVHQYIRFEQITSLLPENLEHYTLADVGCGFGDLYHFLDPKPQTYTGYDLMEEMITIATSNTKQPIYKLDATTTQPKTADLIVCSGALNILSRFETTLFLHNCYNASRKAFVFNALFGKAKEGIFNYLDKPFLEHVAKELGVGEVRYLEGYLEHDITVGWFR